VDWCQGLFHHPLPLEKGFVLESKASSSSLIGGCMWLDSVHHLLLLERIYLLKNPNPLKFDGRLDVLVVAELSLDRIWGRLYVLNQFLIESKA